MTERDVRAAGQEQGVTVSGAVGPPSVSFRAALARLAAHQKTNKGAPAYSRFVNRRLGRYAAAAAFTQGWTPNQVTCLSGATTFVGIAGIAVLPPTGVTSGAVSLALVAGYALDSADGQLARLRGGGSLHGEWLDHVVDAAKAACLHAAVLVSLHRFTFVPEVVQLLPLSYLCVSTTWFFSVVLTDQLRRSRADLQRPQVGSGSRAPLLRSVLALPADYGVMCLLFLLLSRTDLFLVAYGAMFVGSTAIFVASLVSWYRELSAYDTAADSANQGVTVSG